MRLLLIKTTAGTICGEVHEHQGNFVKSPVSLMNPILVDHIPIPQATRLGVQGVAWVRTVNPWPATSIVLNIPADQTFFYTVIDVGLEPELEIVKQYLTATSQQSLLKRSIAQ